MDEALRLTWEHLAFERGVRLCYRLTHGGFVDQSSLTVLDTRQHEGGTAIEISDPFRGGGETGMVFERAADTLFLASFRTPEEGLVVLNEPLPIVRIPCVEGDRIDAEQTGRSELTRSATIAVQLTTTVIEPRRIESPAGIFEECPGLLLRWRFGTRDYSFRYWLAPGWGIVAGQTIGENGMRWEVELTAGRHGKTIIGEMSLLAGPPATATQLAFNPNRPLLVNLTVNDILQAIRPLNVRRQSIVGCQLREVRPGKEPELRFAVGSDDAEGSIVLLLRWATLRGALGDNASLQAVLTEPDPRTAGPRIVKLVDSINLLMRRNAVATSQSSLNDSQT